MQDHHRVIIGSHFVLVPMRGEEFPQFLEVLAVVLTMTQLVYVQRYVDLNILKPAQFQVSSEKLSITSFGREDVRCLTLLVMTIAQVMGITLVYLYYIF